MNELSVGAVGAATIAGIISLLGLIISKEQKISEFRQAWIDELRRCLITYIANLNAISDQLRLTKKNGGGAPQSLMENYKALNEASLGIKFRINSDEDASIRLLEKMERFEELSKKNENLTPEKIEQIEQDFIPIAKDVLKFEWNRVKRGEKIFVYTKRIVLFLIISLILYMLYIFAYGNQTNIVIEDCCLRWI